MAGSHLGTRVSFSTTISSKFGPIVRDNLTQRSQAVCDHLAPRLSAATLDASCQSRAAVLSLGYGVAECSATTFHVRDYRVYDYHACDYRVRTAKAWRAGRSAELHSGRRPPTCTYLITCSHAPLYFYTCAIKAHVAHQRPVSFHEAAHTTARSQRFITCDPIILAR